MKRLKILGLWLTAGFMALSLQAAEVNPVTDPEAATDNQAGQVAQASAAEAAPQTADQEDGQDAESEEDQPSRFIPTEQISQDLGVSFPVDI